MKLEICCIMDPLISWRIQKIQKLSCRSDFVSPSPQLLHALLAWRSSHVESLICVSVAFDTSQSTQRGLAGEPRLPKHPLTSPLGMNWKLPISCCPSVTNTEGSQGSSPSSLVTVAGEGTGVVWFLTSLFGRKWKQSICSWVGLPRTSEDTASLRITTPSEGDTCRSSVRVPEA